MATALPTSAPVHEIGGIRKKWKDRLPVALLFPNTYQVGMSNLGYQLLYGLLNRDDSIVAERFFLQDGPLRSVESNRPLEDFAYCFVSVSFEADFLAYLKMLDKAGILVPVEDDAPIAPGSPFILCGGVATFINPEPLAPYVDAFVVGEVESVIDAILSSIKGSHERQVLRGFLASSVPGCYVPSLYSVSYDEDGRVIKYSSHHNAPLPVKKNVTGSSSICGHSVLLSDHAEFDNIFLVELGRGCSRACRFCAAGFVYRPPRLWSVDAIIGALKKIPATITRVGLLGMEMIRPDDLQQIMSYIRQHHYSLSFSSLRADIVTPELLEIFTESNLKTAVIAPDGPSERLRRVINKQITASDILQAAQSLATTKVVTLKLYFMIGLPTEAMDDIKEMVDLIEEVAATVLPAVKRRKKAMKIVVSVSSFVPKAWTPFQYHGFTPVKELEKRLRFLKERVKTIGNVKIHAEQPKQAFLQAVLAKGDRRLGAKLQGMARAGNWRQYLRKQGVDPDWYALRSRNQEEVFPWEILDHGIQRRYLWKEYQRGLQGQNTPRCRPHKCRSCGVCG